MQIHSMNFTGQAMAPLRPPLAVPCPPSQSDSSRAEMMLIAPELAKQWLANNPVNRALKRRLVTKYGAAMKAGRWRLNGETIIIAKDGAILNGQHRLRGCVDSNAHFFSWVIIGVSGDYFPTIDTGAPRRAGDVHEIAARLAGETISSGYAKCLGAVCNWLNRYSGGTMASQEKLRLSNEESLDVAVAHPEAFSFVRAVCDRKKLRALCSPSISAFCFYVFSRQDADMAHLFFESLETGVGLKDDEPVYLLRERLLKERQIKNARLSAEYICALFFKAWAATRSGKKLRLLLWRYESEPFPQI